MVLMTIFSAAISVFLFTISSICARCTSVSSAALTTTSTASPLMLTTASLKPFADISHAHHTVHRFLFLGIAELSTVDNLQ